MIVKISLLSILSSLTVWESPLVLALVAVIVPAIPVLLILRHTREMDKETQKTKAASEKATERRDTIGERDTLIDKLQAELKRAYERMDGYDKRFTELEMATEQRVKRLEARIVELETRLLEAK